MIARMSRADVVKALEGQPPLLRVCEAAVIARQHIRTIRRAYGDGRLRAVTGGGKSVLIPRNALIDYLCGEV